MLFFYESLSKSNKMGTFTDTTPLVLTYAITPNEISFTGVYVDVEAVSAGVDAVTPALISFEFSMDGGDTFRPVTGAKAEPITGVGQFLGEAGGKLFVGPLMRVTVTPPAGESIAITDVGVRRIRPGQVATLLSYGASGASPSTIVGPLGPNLAADSVSVTLATDEFGQELMAASFPVVIASDQSPIPVDLNSPIGAALIAASVPVTIATDEFGQELMADSLPVVLASDQSPIPVDLNSPIGVNVIADSVAVTLATDEFGQELMAASFPVVIASDQTPIEMAGLIPEQWAGLTVAYPLATQETYSFFEDAAKTIAICVVTVDYVDATKAQLSSVTRV